MSEAFWKDGERARAFPERRGGLFFKYFELAVLAGFKAEGAGG